MILTVLNLISVASECASLFFCDCYFESQRFFANGRDIVIPRAPFRLPKKWPKYDVQQPEKPVAEQLKVKKFGNFTVVFFNCGCALDNFSLISWIASFCSIPFIRPYAGPK